MIKKNILTTLFVLMSFTTMLLAQGEVYGGFKAGINFSTIDGPVEEFNGQELENFRYTNGFHIGFSVNTMLTDYFGLRGEFIYGQKGMEYTFNGSSFLPFYSEDGSSFVLTSGNRNSVLSLTTTHIDLPISAFVKIGRLELSCGLNASFQVGARATGEIIFNGISERGENIEALSIIVDANYNNDKADNLSPLTESNNRLLDGQRVISPSTIEAYYDAPGPIEPLYRRINFALQGGVAFFLNQGLYLSIKGYYGLTDLTKEESDYSFIELNEDNSIILRDDNDRDITIQTSVGFFF
ncbi:MAG: outer membrane beta-barrel protein [Bacteroidota bacterium]